MRFGNPVAGPAQYPIATIRNQFVPLIAFDEVVVRFWQQLESLVGT